MPEIYVARKEDKTRSVPKTLRVSDSEINKVLCAANELTFSLEKSVKAIKIESIKAELWKEYVWVLTQEKSCLTVDFEIVVLISGLMEKLKIKARWDGECHNMDVCQGAIDPGTEDKYLQTFWPENDTMEILPRSLTRAILVVLCAHRDYLKRGATLLTRSVAELADLVPAKTDIILSRLV